MASKAEIAWIYRNRDGLPAEIKAHNYGVTIRRARGDSWEAPENQYRCLATEMEAPAIQAEVSAIQAELSAA
ncbi:hypothetical protein CRT60_21965 [Azospirillum palustre]|uniref:Uncharacterized protein n=1 Tax=Azospirillum palustre TaxID=2044885 RepID=A0A2B8BDX5_9PROT|nr:hypothetical protein [Azospirillum palustre]PGH55919.1 hypothetical protein CRT60_21965 [Azospirillum palustre]